MQKSFMWIRVWLNNELVMNYMLKVCADCLTDLLVDFV